MLFRKNKKTYLRSITSKGRHEFNDKCNPTVVKKQIDANASYDPKKPTPTRRNG